MHFCVNEEGMCNVCLTMAPIGFYWLLFRYMNKWRLLSTGRLYRCSVKQSKEKRLFTLRPWTHYHWVIISRSEKIPFAGCYGLFFQNKNHILQLIQRQFINNNTQNKWMALIILVTTTSICVPPLFFQNYSFLTITLKFCNNYPLFKILSNSLLWYTESMVSRATNCNQE